MPKELKLKLTWEVGDQIGAGGFGRVYAAKSSDHERAVVKLIPKRPGANRELLFVDTTGFRNVIPIIDSGETADSWAIVMPRANQSLREYLEGIGGPVELEAALPILMDVATALTDIDGKIVHRDLKPENILLLKGVWCLADFGISRYTEATTALDTHKYSMSPPYAGPERWRNEHADSSTDIYSFGAIAFELTTGGIPFIGPTIEDFREQHLLRSPKIPSYLAPLFGALIDECLYKAPGARPSASNVIQRLLRIGKAEPRAGLAKLQNANRAEVGRKVELAAKESAKRSADDRRKDLATAAASSLKLIGNSLKNSIMEAAPSAVLREGTSGGWTIRLGVASLTLEGLGAAAGTPTHDGRPLPFTVMASTALNLSIPKNRYEYEGRSHSLWYCDAKEANRYSWFETAFMVHPLIPQRPSRNPFAMTPGDAVQALGPGIGTIQLAWPFSPLLLDNLEEPIDRWANWFAEAAQGHLSHPSSMPERQPDGSWRQS
jgi:serine/threonine-protein kinase